MPTSIPSSYIRKSVTSNSQTRWHVRAYDKESRATVALGTFSTRRDAERCFKDHHREGGGLPVATAATARTTTTTTAKETTAPAKKRARDRDRDRARATTPAKTKAPTTTKRGAAPTATTTTTKTTKTKTRAPPPPPPPSSPVAPASSLPPKKRRRIGDGGGSMELLIAAANQHGGLDALTAPSARPRGGPKSPRASPKDVDVAATPAPAPAPALATPPRGDTPQESHTVLSPVARPPAALNAPVPVVVTSPPARDENENVDATAAAAAAAATATKPPSPRSIWQRLKATLSPNVVPSPPLRALQLLPDNVTNVVDVPRRAPSAAAPALPPAAAAAAEETRGVAAFARHATSIEFWDDADENDACLAEEAADVLAGARAVTFDALRASFARRGLKLELLFRVVKEGDGGGGGGGGGI